MHLVITGVPGTGKSTLAKRISQELDCEVVHANELVKKEKLWMNKKDGTVDLQKLRKKLTHLLKKSKKLVVEGHLLCEFPLPCERVLVLRCRPDVLKKRLEKRRYPKAKVRENIWAELLDYCDVRAVDEYGSKNVVQVDNTHFHSTHAALAHSQARQNEEVNWGAWMRSPERLARLVGTPS